MAQPVPPRVMYVPGDSISAEVCSRDRTERSACFHATVCCTMSAPKFVIVSPASFRPHISAAAPTFGEYDW